MMFLLDKAWGVYRGSGGGTSGKSSSVELS